MKLARASCWPRMELFSPAARVPQEVSPAFAKRAEVLLHLSSGALWVMTYRRLISWIFFEQAGGTKSISTSTC